MFYGLCSLDFALHRLHPRCYRALTATGFSRVDCREQVCIGVIHLRFGISLCIAFPFPAREGEGEGRLGWRLLYLRAVPLGVSWKRNRGTAVRTGRRARVLGVALGTGPSDRDRRCVAARRDSVSFARF
jgi:hypothetical protein